MSSDTEALWNAITTGNTRALVEQIRAAGPRVLHVPADERCVYCGEPADGEVVDPLGRCALLCSECTR